MIKVDNDTHKSIKSLSAVNDMSMMDYVRNIVMVQDPNEFRISTAKIKLGNREGVVINSSRTISRNTDNANFNLSVLLNEPVGDFLKSFDDMVESNIDDDFLRSRTTVNINGRSNKHMINLTCEANIDVYRVFDDRVIQSFIEIEDYEEKLKSARNITTEIINKVTKKDS